MAIKKNKNNPDNKNSGKSKQIKPRESGYCETQCKDVGTCEKYKKYISRLKSGKRGLGIQCSK